MPRKFAEKTGNLGWYKEAERGGHFASLEEPAIYAQHLQESIAHIWRD